MGAHLVYDNARPFLEIYCDADWGGDPDKDRSTGGIIMLMKGIPIYHKSKVQSNTAKSTANAELIALCDCVEETIWVQGLLTDFDLNVNPVIQCDNKPAIQTMSKEVLSKGNKHIARRYNFIKGYLDERGINVVHVPSKKNLSDLMTKPFARPDHERLTNAIIQSKPPNSL